MDKVDYEGVLPRFERLYLKRDITKLKKSLQDEIMSLVEKAPCPTCGGAGLNPKALASRINGKNIVDYGEMTARELVAELRGVTDAMGVSLARQISSYLERMDEGGKWTLTTFAELSNDAVGADVAADQIKVYAADTVEGLDSASPMTSGVEVKEKKSAIKTTIEVTPPDPTAAQQFFKVKFGE